MAEKLAASLRSVNKYFNDTQVLFNVDLDLHEGEVHALVGENGAGKSTLGKIIGGYYSLSSGELSIQGKKVSHWTPIEALSVGVAMIHQELTLVPELTVAQNVFLGFEHTSRFGVLKSGLTKRFNELNEKCGFALEPGAKVGSLRIADQQKVEIMRALSRDVRIVIMDEPTSSLSAEESRQLHRIVVQLKNTGCAVIYITHFLDHVLEYSDRVTVMRDGNKIKTELTSSMCRTSIVEAMLGHSSDVTFPEKKKYLIDYGVPSLEVRNIRTETGIEDVSLRVYPGEIVGLLGLVGSGRTEIARAIYGADEIVEGEVLIGGVLSGERSPGGSIKGGLVMIPEDRRKQGLVLPRNVRENVTLGSLDHISNYGVIDQAKEYEAVKGFIAQLGVVPADVDGEIWHYSGGNQQKVLFAKWLMTDPCILILDEPTRGIDIGAKRRIYELIFFLAAAGKAIILISSEFEEVIGLSDRAYYIKKGKTCGEVKTEGLTDDVVLKSLFEIE